MKHYGDITKINGAEIEPVWIICGGSPCQDLSMCGKRAGLSGARSGLFMEQIRIIKEMREHDKASGRSDKSVRCRWMVWENVIGAFSSGTPSGEDFRIVLEETAKVTDKTAVIPRPTDGKWTPSGCIMGDGWSIAWRVHDAQFWGVPHRRKRISLVADFGGDTAPKILFESKRQSGSAQWSETKRGVDSRLNERSSIGTVYGCTVWRKVKLTGDIANTITCSSGNPRGTGAKVLQNNRVRSLTPLECERLQGYPDNWTNIGDWIDSKGKKHKGNSDAPRYVALGNSIALPFWKWMAKRMVSYITNEEPTMGSLFDGIGGFPLSYQEAGCRPVWASEIEEFPMAVTKVRFPEEVG